jgi:cupin superfamily acireductone dioxygenase involved in methionine salvage
LHVAKQVAILRAFWLLHRRFSGTQSVVARAKDFRSSINQELSGLKSEQGFRNVDAVRLVVMREGRGDEMREKREGKEIWR